MDEGSRRWTAGSRGGLPPSPAAALEAAAIFTGGVGTLGETEAFFGWKSKREGPMHLLAKHLFRVAERGGPACAMAMLAAASTASAQEAVVAKRPPAAVRAFDRTWAAHPAPPPADGGWSAPIPTPLPSRSTREARGRDFTARAGTFAAARRPDGAQGADHALALRSANGLGVFATVRDQAVDAASPDHLVKGPSGSLFDEAAGLGWRRDNLSAMVGYMRPEDRQPDYRDPTIIYHRSRPRVGFGLSLHY
jgi:hypothetical protein